MNPSNLIYHIRTWRIALCLWAAVVVAIAGMARWCVSHNADTPATANVSVDSLLRVVIPAEEATRVMRLDYRGFTSYFDPQWHIPRCVAYMLTAERLNGNVPRAKHFAADPDVDGCPQPADYADSNLDRGHLAPAAHMKWDSVAMRESFLMTNVCPQNHRFNERAWQRLEQKCGEWALQFDTVLVFCGPVPDYGADTLRPSGIVVPAALFKVVLLPTARPPRAIAFIYRNRGERADPASHAVSVRDVERGTGLDFFAAYPRSLQDSIETAPPATTAWLH